jgi:hypothetical protein
MRRLWLGYDHSDWLPRSAAPAQARGAINNYLLDP